MLLMYTQEFAFVDDQRRYVPLPAVMGFVSKETEQEAVGGALQEPLEQPYEQYWIY